MKRANGTGSVVKLSGNRRNPWYAKVTTGFDERGFPIIKILRDQNGAKYFKDRTIPDLLLAKYNMSSHTYNLDKRDYTFKQLYEEWAEIYLPTSDEKKHERITHEKAKGKIGTSNACSLTRAFKLYSSLYNKIYATLRKEDFQRIINSTEGKRTKLFGMKNLILKLDEYALENDIIDKGYGRLLTIEPDESSSNRTPFSYEEIETIWKNEGNLYADILLILLYTGMRIEELLVLETQNIHLDLNYLVGGLKTASGKNRTIPIHHEIKHIIERYYSNEFYLFNSEANKRLEYHTYRIGVSAFLKDLGIKHTSHEARYTLRSELDRLGANKVCTDKILGHKSNSVGEQVYTQKSIEELIETIELIDYRKNKNKKVTYLRAVN